MQIKLLHAVLHDGHRVEAGATGILDDDLALTLIDSGAAEEVTANEPAQPVDLPERLLAPVAEATPATPETPPAQIAETASAEASQADPTAEDTSAETGKAAKTKGSK